MYVFSIYTYLFMYMYMRMYVYKPSQRSSRRVLSFRDSSVTLSLDSEYLRSEL